MERIPIPTTARERAELFERAERSAEVRHQIVRQCADASNWTASCHFWINVFAFGPDPREAHAAGRSEVPFFLFDYQVGLIQRLNHAVANREDLWVLKSRDGGVTWVINLWAEHGWLFRVGWNGLLGSNTQADVDNGTVDSHFGKLTYTLRRLPGWFLRDVLSGFDVEKHALKLRMTNTSKARGCDGNLLTGDSSTKNFGRGPRKTFVFIDEAAAFEEFMGAMASTSGTTYTRIVVSTPQGMANGYAQMIHLPEIWDRRLEIHWSQHPWHDQDWYQSMCKRLVLPEIIAQELDLSFTASTRGVVHPTWSEQDFGVFEYDEQATTFVSWDAGLDETALIWWQRNPVTGDETALDCYKRSDKPIAWFTPFVTGMFGADHVDFQYTAEEMAKIAVHSTWRSQPIHYADTSLEQRDVGTGESPSDVLRRHGIHLVTPKSMDFKTRRAAVLQGMRKLRVNLPGAGSPIGCELLDDAMRLARFQERSLSSQASTEPQPIHDGTSHLRSAVEIFYMCRPVMRTWKRPTGNTRSGPAYNQLVTRR